MPFQYKAKEGSTRQKFTKRELENAIQEVKNGASIRGTAVKYGIDRTTLRRYKLNETRIETFDEKGSPYKKAQIFTIAEEKLLVEYLLNCSKMNYGLTRRDAMKLAVNFAKVNNKEMPKSWLTNNEAGKDWFRGFLRRNPGVSLRTPEATSLSRATSFNKKNVAEFFQNLKTVRDKYKFEAQNIYNCDETGCTTVQRCPRVIASKKDKQVGQVTSAERGTLVTVCFAVNAIGNVIPPFFIFPRVKYRDDFVSDGPTGSDGDAYTSGWMTNKSFLKYMEHFKKHSHASKENRVLLILDNHESHVNIEVVKYAKENGITLLTLPPHCSNKLQPLDISVYSSLKNRYNTAMNNWMLSNPGKTVTIYNIPGFINTIFSQTFSQSNILNGFKNSGIHPFNPDIFTDEDFLCSAVTDRDYNDEAQPENSKDLNSNQNQLKFSTGQDVSTSHDVLIEESDGSVQRSLTSQGPSTSQHQVESTVLEQISVISCVEVTPQKRGTAIRQNTPISSPVPHNSKQVISHSPIASTSKAETEKSQTNIISPEVIRPYPKAAPRKSNRGRQPGKTKILTQTPEKTDDINSDPTNICSKATTNVNPKNRQKASNKRVTKKVLQDNDIENILASSNDRESSAKYQKQTNKLDIKKKTIKKQLHRKGKLSKEANFQKGKKKTIDLSESDSENENVIPYADTSDDEGPELDNRWYCFICETEEVMDMRLCISCKRYVHEVCVGLTDKDKDCFVCHECP